MKVPRHPEEYADRFIDCEFDLEGDILAVLDESKRSVGVALKPSRL